MGPSSFGCCGTRTRRKHPSVYVMFTFVFLGNHLPTRAQNVDINKTIPEELGLGEIVVNLTAEPEFLRALNEFSPPGILGRNASSGLSFNMLTSRNQHSQYFGVDAGSGAVYVKKVIDREQICSFREDCVLNLQLAGRSTHGGFFALVNLRINVTDINDNQPEFTPGFFQLNISENAEIGQSFRLPTATDRDLGARGSIVQYKNLVSDAKFGLRAVETEGYISDLFLTLESTVARESLSTYQVLVGAVDAGSPALTGTLTVSIHILDINDNSPVFEQPSYEVTIPETATENQLILQVHATDADTGINGELFYSFSAQQPPDYLSYFRIEPSSGRILLAQSVESRAGDEIVLLVEASDLGHPPKMSRVEVKIIVEDTINSIPEITVDTLGGSMEGVAEVSEYAEAGVVVAYVSVRDTDTGLNGLVTCRLSQSQFALVLLDNQGKYKAELKAQLDREQQDLYNLTLTCSDHGSPALTSTADFAIRVLDENDHAPVFSQNVYETTLFENNPIGAYITQLTTTDKDLGENAKISYKFVKRDQNHFEVDEAGRVTTKVSFDREIYDSIVAVVVATDRGNPPLSSSATVSVQLLDVNDMKPVFTQAVYTFQVDEEQTPGTYVDTVLASDQDLGSNSDLIYLFRDLHDSASRNFILGGSDGVIKTSTVLDREQKDLYSLVILAIDKGVPPLTGSATVLITIKDTNDNDPFFIFPNSYNSTVSIPHTVQPYQTIVAVQAFDNDMDQNAMILYSVSSINTSSSFDINPTSGSLFTKDRLTKEKLGIYILTVMAHDQGQKQQRATQIPLTVEVYFDNTTALFDASSGRISKDMMIIIVVTSTLFLAALIVVLAVLCIRRQRMNKTGAASVPKSASTSSTTKLHRDCYISPGVNCSSPSFYGKQDEAAFLKKKMPLQKPAEISEQPYIVVLSQPKEEVQPEIVKISVNGHQSASAYNNHLKPADTDEDDRFSTFRSQEDILSCGLRYGSLKRQDSISYSKKDDSFDDNLSTGGSTSDSGRGGSDVDVSNFAAAAAAARQERGLPKALTPVSIKSGISHRLSPLPLQQTTLLTFRGESPNFFNFDSDSDTLTRKSHAISSSTPLTPPTSEEGTLKFGQGSSAANFNSIGEDKFEPLDKGYTTAKYFPLQPVNFARADSRSLRTAETDLQNSISKQPHRLAAANMYEYNFTYPRYEVAQNHLGVNQTNSLTRVPQVPPVQSPDELNEFPHHLYGAESLYRTDPCLNYGNVGDTAFRTSYNDQLPFYSLLHQDSGNDHSSRIYAEDDHSYLDDRCNGNDRTNSAVNVNQHGVWRQDTSPHNVHLGSSNQNNRVSRDEDFLLPPYPEVLEEEEDEDDDSGDLSIHPGFTGYIVAGERSALFPKSMHESSA